MGFVDAVRRLSAFVAGMEALQLIAELSIWRSLIPLAAFGLFLFRPGVEMRPP